MRKQIMLKVMATALAAVVAAPIGSLTINTTRPVIVKAATAKAAKAAAEPFSSGQAAPAMADAAGETMASDTAGGAGEGAAASEENMPISPLTGARTREYKASRIR